jgi:hypothetical protein
MKVRGASSLAVLAAAVSVSQVSTSARADELLIRETESLRNSLSFSDPSRLPLTLRLADLLMNEAARATSNKTQLQSRALALYDEALKDRVQGIARTKIDFQRARLLTDLGQVDRSIDLWKQLAAQRDLPEVSREAALRLAESGDVMNAAQWYQQALELCQGGDLCSYIRFKRAWLFRQAASGGVADDRAIAEMELALFDSKGQIREESLRDYLVFLGEKTTDEGAARAAPEQPAARSALSKIEALSQKLDRKSLVGDLAEGYFAAGNKLAGTFVLAQAQRAEPRFSRLARLAEEQYGLRDWDAFTASLEEISSERGQALLASAPEADRAEGEKFLRRLVIQLDGERISQPSRLADFQKASLGYIALFPASSEKAKFQEGWIASESDAQKKLDQLAEWIRLEPQSIKLREFRAGIAQKAGLMSIVAAEMDSLALIAETAVAPSGASTAVASSKAREYRYAQARALYESKDFTAALPIFESLARVASGTQPDGWAIQAQNLALDILNQQKNWDGIIARSSDWLDSEWTKSAPASLKKELTDMSEVRNQARFQKAVALGETSQALAQFMEFCRSRVYVDKSCENARVLSIKLKEQESLLAVLEQMGPSKQVELAQELEASGYFGRAATLLEKMAAGSKSRNVTDMLKIALLWELSGNAAEFSRSVDALRMSKLVLDEKQEALWLSMALDIAEKSPAFLQASTLKMLKGEESRGRLAEWLEARANGTAETRKILMAAKFQTGSAWAKLVTSEIESMIAEAGKISFYGRNSRSQFERRLAAMVKIAKRADEFFPKCDAPTKSALASMLKQAYETLAQEIRQSPIPEGVPEEAIAELKLGLEQMAKPFDDKAAVYAQVILPAAAPASDVLAVTSAHSAAAGSLDSRITEAQTALHRSPESVQALEALRDSYRTLGRARLAGYFEGRLNAAGGRK